MRSLRLVREFDRHLLLHVTRPMSSETGAGDDDDVGLNGVTRLCFLLTLLLLAG
jgi:hypothetical protein